MAFDLATAKPVEEKRQGFDLSTAKPVEEAPAGPVESFLAGDPRGRALLGLARGGKDVVDTGAEWLAKGFDKLTGGGQPGEADRVRKLNESGKADFERRYGNDAGMQVPRVIGQVGATFPVGGALGGPVKLLANAGIAPKIAGPLADALTTFGARAKGASGAPALAARTAGGAITGGASAALVEPDSAPAGAVIGGALPVTGKIAAAAGRAAGDAVRPFLASGQEQIAGEALKRFSTNPVAARAALAASREMVPGSAPTAVMSAGDEGLAGLSRTLQSVNPTYAASLSARQASQNAARTTAIEEIAGNPGKIAVAKQERDQATSAMREAALSKAGDLPAAPLARKLDAMLADPNNAGKTAQQALKNVKEQLAGMTAENGTVNARALYEMRKDIGLAMEGKLQGEAGNLKYAKGQLATVKGHIDDAIHAATGAPEAGGKAVVPAGTKAPGTWRDYLKTYADMSKPIDQMETLSDVLKRVQTGTVDKSGNAILSAAKLNNIMKNEGADLAKTLTPKQLQSLRALASDLNASQLAMNSGKAVGSDTVQKLSQGQLLDSTLGRAGRSTPVTATIGRVLQIPYGTANRQITDRLGNALLDPEEAARLLAMRRTDRLRAAMAPVGAATARVAPLLPASQNR
jgi:hypothetical protein